MITEIDYFILNLIQNLRTEFLDRVIKLITHLGDSGVIWIILAIVMLFFKYYRRTGIRVIIGLALSTVLFTLIMKELVARERPFNNPMGLLNAQTIIIPEPFGRYSFPSGHTLTSFVAAATVFLEHKKIGTACIVLASLIAFSRLYLYVHFPSDIIFGALFGILTSIAVKKADEKITERKKHRV